MNNSIIQKSQLEGALRLDAEYYQPEYLNLDQVLRGLLTKPLAEVAGAIIAGPFGSAILDKDYQNEGVPLLRVANLNDWFVKDENLVFLDEKLSNKLKRHQVQNEDIVVSQRGTIAMFSKVTDRFPIWNVSANLIAIKKSEKTNFEYLLAFLNSKYGISQLYRRLSGQVQPKITTDDVKEILIYIPSNTDQKNVAGSVISAQKELEKSNLVYSQAENLLLEELELKDFKLSEDLAYTVNFSDLKSANRADAEHFQPKYDSLISKIKKQNAKFLGDLVSMKKGFEPGSEAYEEEGKLFIRVSSLSKNGIEDKDQKYLSDDLYKKLKKDYEPRIGEILLTKDATPGIAYTLKESIWGIVSGGILRLKLKEDIDPEYLTLCINSIVGQSQAEQDAGGSIIAHWKPEQIKNLQIPILPKTTQQKIADLVRQSHESRKKAKELLEEAKRKVEAMIEKSSK